MSNRVRTMLLFFVDYLVCIVFQIFGLVFLSWALDFPWVDPVYSILFSLVLFARVYRRGNKAAGRDLRNHEKKPLFFDGLLMVLPLVVFQLVIIFAYRWVQGNPLGGTVVNVIYSFPDNLPRVAKEITLAESLVPYLRIWFGSVMGFMGQGFSALVALLVPLSHVLAGFFGYLAGLKHFYILDFLIDCWRNIWDRFYD